MRILAVAIIFLFSFHLSGQAIQSCGDTFIKKQLENKYPGVSELINQTFEKVQASTESRSVILRIPVVFHVVYNNDDQNLSDEILQSQIDVLNEDFRRMNANASETRDIFLSVAADSEIEFFLAGEDPDGNPSNGITRTFTDKTSFIDISFAQILEATAECGTDFTDPEVAACIAEIFSDVDLDAVKSSDSDGKDAWDPERYLNIWVANFGLDSGFGGEPIPFILGFAYPPMEAPNWPSDVFPEELERKDGVVLHYPVVGRNNPFVGTLAGTNDQGRTCVHEVGHYLGLRHIWGDGDCTMDDGISDTPKAGSDSQATTDINDCSDFYEKDSCDDDGMPDMIENYMDYSIESCQNTFTAEQVTLMRAMLEGPRSGLLTNDVSGVDETFNQFTVFPNPSSGTINVASSEQVIESINVYDTSGKIVLTTNELSFEIPSKESGIYFIEIINESHSTFKKIILSK